jgi:hypothetical protein
METTTCSCAANLGQVAMLILSITIKYLVLFLDHCSWLVGTGSFEICQTHSGFSDATLELLESYAESYVILISDLLNGDRYYPNYRWF